VSLVRKFVHTVDFINRNIGLSLMWMVLVVALLLTIQSFARYVFQHPLIWSFELTMFICGGFFFLVGGYCLYTGSHVNMDILRNRLSLRKGAILDSITALFLIAFATVMVIYGTLIAGEAITWQLRDIDSSWQPLLWPVRVTIPIGSCLLLLQAIAKLVRDLHIAVTGRKIE